MLSAQTPGGRDADKERHKPYRAATSLSGYSS